MAFFSKKLHVRCLTWSLLRLCSLTFTNNLVQELKFSTTLLWNFFSSSLDFNFSRGIQKKWTVSGKILLIFNKKAGFTDFMFCLNTFSVYFAWKDNMCWEIEKWFFFGSININFWVFFEKWSLRRIIRTKSKYFLVKGFQTKARNKLVSFKLRVITVFQQFWKVQFQ